MITKSQVKYIQSLGHKKFRDAEGETRRAGFDVATDDAEQQAADRHGDALERRTARQRRAGQQAE